MRFGVREICNVVFKAKSDVKIGNTQFKKNQPVLYMDSAKTSTIEGAATTVYATGGRGNTRLIAWEGEKTLTFTVEDALLSPIGFAILSGAGLLKGATGGQEKIHVHATTQTTVGENGIDLTDALGAGEEVCKDAPIYVVPVDSTGGLDGAPVEGTTTDGKIVAVTGGTVAKNTAVFVDYYVIKNAATVSELQIDAENFAGSYYVEASTLFRRQGDNVDLPAEITFPNVKIQSNFTFTMAATGDPSTFTFTMDAMPGYTMFNRTRKVLCAIQIVDDAEATVNDLKTVFPCDEAGHDSVDGELGN